jgi:hypothetical protein
MSPMVAEDHEHRLAVLTSWSLWGSFGTASVISAFAWDSYLVALCGYALLITGFVSHIIINWVYRTSFRNGEIVTGISLFGVCVLMFLASWLFDPDFTRVDVYSGLTGLAVTVAAFLAYLTTRYGLTGSFSMFHMRHP